MTGESKPGPGEEMQIPEVSADGLKDVLERYRKAQARLIELRDENRLASMVVPSNADSQRNEGEIGLLDVQLATVGDVLDLILPKKDGSSWREHMESDEQQRPESDPEEEPGQAWRSEKEYME